MRICVYGAGAIGGHLAVRYARGGARFRCWPAARIWPQSSATG